jgi:hypothetical protein
LFFFAFGKLKAICMQAANYTLKFHTYHGRYAPLSSPRVASLQLIGITMRAHVYIGNESKMI